MEYKIIISSNEYFLPTTVYLFNKEVLSKYSTIENDITYIDFDLLKENEGYEVLNKIAFQCTSSIGELVLDDNEARSRYDKLGPKMRLDDNLAKINYQKGNEEIAKEKLINMTEMVLDFYKEELEQEEKNKSR